MNQGRTTSLEERLKIVRYCLENNRNYSLTMNNFRVSYQQVYVWVHKYEKGGANALIDRRGRKRPDMK